MLHCDKFGGHSHGTQPRHNLALKRIDEAKGAPCLDRTCNQAMATLRNELRTLKKATMTPPEKAPPEPETDSGDSSLIEDELTDSGDSSLVELL